MRSSDASWAPRTPVLYWPHRNLLRWGQFLELVVRPDAATLDPNLARVAAMTGSGQHHDVF